MILVVIVFTLDGVHKTIFRTACNQPSFWSIRAGQTTFSPTLSNHENNNICWPVYWTKTIIIDFFIVAYNEAILCLNQYVEITRRLVQFTLDQVCWLSLVQVHYAYYIDLLIGFFFKKWRQWSIGGFSQSKVILRLICVL